MSVLLAREYFVCVLPPNTLIFCQKNHHLTTPLIQWRDDIRRLYLHKIIILLLCLDIYICLLTSLAAGKMRPVLLVLRFSLDRHFLHLHNHGRPLLQDRISLRHTKVRHRHRCIRRLSLVSLPASTKRMRPQQHTEVRHRHRCIRHLSLVELRIGQQHTKVRHRHRCIRHLSLIELPASTKRMRPQM